MLRDRWVSSCHLCVFFMFDDSHHGFLSTNSAMMLSVQTTQPLDNLSLLVAAANTVEKQDSQRDRPQSHGDLHHYGTAVNINNNRHRHSTDTTTSSLPSPMDLDDSSNDKAPEKREWSHKKYRPFHHSKPRTHFWYPASGEPPVKVTVTDVTCNYLRVTFVESPTDAGFFKSSMDT